MYRTELPDGTFTKTEWTSWQQTIWDNNDTVLQSQWYTDIQNLVLPPAVAPPGETEAERKIRVARRAEVLALQEAAAKAAVHAGTPTLIHTDTLARLFYTIQHNRYPDNNNNPVDQMIRSYVNLDIQGNRLSVVDGYRITAAPANDPLTLQYRYNMLQGIAGSNARLPTSPDNLCMPGMQPGSSFI